MITRCLQVGGAGTVLSGVNSWSHWGSPRFTHSWPTQKKGDEECRPGRVRGWPGFKPGHPYWQAKKGSCAKMRCEQASVPLVGSLRRAPTWPQEWHAEKHMKLRDSLSLRPWRVEARATRKSIRRVGTTRKDGVWEREPWAFTGLGCRAQHDGGGFHGCGSMSVSYVGAWEGELALGRPGHPHVPGPPGRGAHRLFVGCWGSRKIWSFKNKQKENQISAARKQCSICPTKLEFSFGHGNFFLKVLTASITGDQPSKVGESWIRRVQPPLGSGAHGLWAPVSTGLSEIPASCLAQGEALLFALCALGWWQMTSPLSCFTLTFALGCTREKMKCDSGWKHSL